MEPTLTDRLAQIKDICEDVAADKTKTSHQNVVVALLNAAALRLEQHIRDAAAKAAAPAPVPIPPPKLTTDK